MDVRWSPVARNALTAALLCLAGCGEEFLLVDPEVDYEIVEAPSLTGPARLQLGLLDEQFFEPIRDGGSVPIVAGFQGGTWVMPALRASGLPDRLLAGGSVRIADGEIVGLIEQQEVALRSTPSGFLELSALPIPIWTPVGASGVDALYGRSAVLEVHTSAEGDRSASATIRVVLEQG